MALSNFSIDFEAKSVEISCWVMRRIFTPKCSHSEKTLLLNADFAMQMSRIGGSSETEVKEFAVMPRGVPSVSYTHLTLPTMFEV